MSSSIGTSGVLFAHADGGGRRSFRTDPRLRARGAGSVLPAGRHALGRWVAALVAGRQTGPRLRGARRRGRDRPGGCRGSRVPPVPDRGAHAAPRSAGCRARFIGLTARHTRGHMTRALMEGVVFSPARRHRDHARAGRCAARRSGATGGGAPRRSGCSCRPMSYGAAVHRLAIEEGAAYGAALLGHVAAGRSPSVGGHVRGPDARRGHRAGSGRAASTRRRTRCTDVVRDPTRGYAPA